MILLKHLKNTKNLQNPPKPSKSLKLTNIPRSGRLSVLPIDLISKMSLLRIKCPPLYLFHAADFSFISEYLSISKKVLFQMFSSNAVHPIKRYFRPRVSLTKKHVTVRLFEEIYGQFGIGSGA